MTDRTTARADLKDAIAQAAAYLAPFKRASMPLDEWLRGQGGGGAFKAALPATEDYDVTRADLVNRLTDAFLTFVSSQRGQASRNAARKAVAEDVPAAFYAGYADAGGEDTDDDDEKWLTAEQARQLDFLTDAFTALADDRDNETATEAAIDARVELWADTLDGIYSEGYLRGSKNIMCYFDGDDGAETCDDCQELKDGPPRSVKWILAHEKKPFPGNKKFKCGCWKCQHNWFSVKTDEQVTF